MKRHWKISLLIAATAVALMPLLLFGQDAPESPSGALPSPAREVDLLTLFNLGIPILTVFVIEGIKRFSKKYAPAIPKAVLPLLAPFVGYLVAYGLQFTGLDLTTGWGAALYGTAGTWVHSLFKHLKAFEAVGPAKE